MANTIHLISKGYLNSDKVSHTVEKVAQKLFFNSGKTYYPEFDVLEINLFKEELDEYLQVNISSEKSFLQSFNNLFNINGYGMMINIECYYENPMLIPFLKEMLKEMPELLVYNEEILGGNGAYVYNKSHLENFSGTDSYVLLGNPPQNLNNLA